MLQHDQQQSDCSWPARLIVTVPEAALGLAPTHIDERKRAAVLADEASSVQVTPANPPVPLNVGTLGTAATFDNVTTANIRIWPAIGVPARVTKLEPFVPSLPLRMLVRVIAILERYDQLKMRFAPLSQATRMSWPLGVTGRPVAVSI